LRGGPGRGCNVSIGLKGVLKVASGFKGFREINTVTYDPGLVSPDEMVSALKSAGTYLGKAED
jgi:hypothetical protein